MDLHVGDLDAPDLRLDVDDGLDIGVQPGPLRQHLIQRVLAEDRAQGGLGQHHGGVEERLHVDDGGLRIDNLEVENRVDLHRHIVLGDNVLRRDLDHLNAQVDPDHLLDKGDQQYKTGAPDLVKAAKCEHDCPFVLAQYLDCCRQNDKGGRYDEEQQDR